MTMHPVGFSDDNSASIVSRDITILPEVLSSEDGFLQQNSQFILAVSGAAFLDTISCKTVNPGLVEIFPAGFAAW